MELKGKKILITGGRGFVGTNLIQELEKKGLTYYAPTKEEYDLRKEKDVKKLFSTYQPNIVLHLAGKVGGIGANKAKPGDFFYDNIMMGTLVMEYARQSNVEKVVALAAGCGYPKYIPTPFSEEDFWKDLPDENSTVLLPANLYGPHDNFNLETSHVVPALIKKFINAKKNNLPNVEVWGSGKASREFLYVKDTVKAIIDAIHCDESGPFNLGTGKETTVKELVETISNLVEFKGKIVWDSSRPDGQPKRFYDMNKFKETFGYVPNTTLIEGLKETIEWYEKNK